MTPCPHPQEGSGWRRAVGLAVHAGLVNPALGPDQPGLSSKFLHFSERRAAVCKMQILVSGYGNSVTFRCPAKYSRWVLVDNLVAHKRWV